MRWLQSFGMQSTETQGAAGGGFKVPVIPMLAFGKAMDRTSIYCCVTCRGRIGLEQQLGFRLLLT